ncbi:MAG: GtrA family protein [Chthoniobacter sp.]
MTDEPLANPLIDENTAPAPASQRQRALLTRFTWFLAGSGVNYLLISLPYKWLETHTHFTKFELSACSLTVSTSFFFVWNYFVNFRTDTRKREALPRYIMAVGIMLFLSSNTLAFLKSHDFHHALSLGHFPLDLDIVATQFFLSGLKFFLYHKWVFPLPKESNA